MSRSKKRSGVKELTPGQFLIQVARHGERRTRRVAGTIADAQFAHAELLLQLEQEHQASKTSMHGSPGLSRLPTLKEWLEGRYAERSRVLHGSTTAKVVRSYVLYLLTYLGDRKLDEAGTPATVNWYVERRMRDGALSFAGRADGQKRRPRVRAVSNVGINKTLSILRAALNLAHQEGILREAPRIEMLPEGDARPIVPPTDTEIEAILAEAERMRGGAPFFPEAIELAIETGLRKEEAFQLTWGSVDVSLGPNREGAIRVEEQGRGRLVGGKLWTPKNRRFRIIPLSPRAREVLATLREKQRQARQQDHVLPNRDGCPYVRTGRAGEGSGADSWRVLKEATGHTVRWHDLRHVFAVRCLQRGVPITLVSQWLGHSDINLTVKRYGRFAGEAREQWTWMETLAQPVRVVASRPSSLRPVGS